MCYLVVNVQKVVWGDPAPSVRSLLVFIQSVLKDTLLAPHLLPPGLALAEQSSHGSGWWSLVTHGVTGQWGAMCGVHVVLWHYGEPIWSPITTPGRLSSNHWLAQQCHCHQWTFLNPLSTMSQGVWVNVSTNYLLTLQRLEFVNSLPKLEEIVLLWPPTLLTNTTHTNNWMAPMNVASKVQHNNVWTMLAQPKLLMVIKNSEQEYPHMRAIFRQLQASIPIIRYTGGLASTSIKIDQIMSPALIFTLT